MPTTQIDVLNGQVAQLNAQIALNLANIAFTNLRLQKQITDIEAEIATLDAQ